jgi:hypothetical protein
MAKTAEKKPKTGGRQRSFADNKELAIVLSHAAAFGPSSAAREFGVNRKTIQRYQAELKSGNNPELSRLVAEEAEQRRVRSRDKMQRAMDVLLDRIIDQAPTATLTEASVSLEKVGDLYGSFKVLGVKPDSEGEEAASDAGLGGKDDGSKPPAPPVH